MAFSIVLEDKDHTICCLLLFTEVTNAAEVRKLIMSGQVEASLIKPQMVGAKWFNTNIINHTHHYYLAQWLFRVSSFFYLMPTTVTLCICHSLSLVFSQGDAS